jgi:hypothetical protein
LPSQLEAVGSRRFLKLSQDQESLIIIINHQSSIIIIIIRNHQAQS